MWPSRLLFVALGFGLGLALGLLIPRDATRGRALPPRVVREAVPVTAARPLPQAPHRAPAWPPPLSNDGAPSFVVEPLGLAAADDELEPGTGRLVADFTGAHGVEPSVFVEGRRLDGEWASYEYYAEDGVVTCELLAGTHTVTWMEGSNALSPRVLDVRIEAGCVTRIDVTDSRLPRSYRAPSGLGRLEVSVAGLDGSPLADTAVTLRGREFHGGEESIERRTNDEGRACFDVLPGPCVFQVGLREEPVEILAGETVSIAVRYRDEGELVLDGSLPGKVGLVSVEGGHRLRTASRRTGPDRAGRSFVYLPPGEYEITYMDRQRCAGTAVVRPLRVTRPDLVPPPGGLHLEILLPEGMGPVGIQVIVLNAETGRWVGNVSTYLVGTFSVDVPCLETGCYRIRIAGALHAFEPYEEEVRVGTSVLDWPVRLVPK